MNAEFTPLKKILIDMPFESESLLEQEINSALSFGRSNQRNDIDVNAELVTSVNERIDVEINLKGNGLDHILYNKKESLRINVNNETYNGMSEFSLQHPLVRDFQLEPIFLKLLKTME